MTALVCLCFYCKQGALHPLLQDSDWSNKDWDVIKAKTREQSKSLIDLNDPKPKTDMEHTTDISKVPFSKPQIGQVDQKEEPLEVMASLVPPPPMTEASDYTTGNTNGEEL